MQTKQGLEIDRITIVNVVKYHTKISTTAIQKSKKYCMPQVRHLIYAHLIQFSQKDQKISS